MIIFGELCSDKVIAERVFIHALTHIHTHLLAYRDVYSQMLDNTHGHAYMRSTESMHTYYSAAAAWIKIEMCLVMTEETFNSFEAYTVIYAEVVAICSWVFGISGAGCCG